MSDITTLKKRQEERFSVVDMEPIEDDHELSWQAKCILIYLLDRPDDWEVNKQDLVNRSRNGKKSVTTALNELKENGYLKIQRDRGENGKIVGTTWLVTQNPRILPLDGENNPQSKKPDAGSSDAGMTDAGNPPQTNRHTTITDEHNTEKNAPAREETSSPSENTFSEQAEKLGDWWLEKIDENLPKRRVPEKGDYERVNYYQAVQNVLDHGPGDMAEPFTAEEIRETLEWVYDSEDGNFWQDKFKRWDQLRKNLMSAYEQMNNDDRNIVQWAKKEVKKAQGAWPNFSAELEQKLRELPNDVAETWVEMRIENFTKNPRSARVPFGNYDKDEILDKVNA